MQASVFRGRKKKNTLLLISPDDILSGVPFLFARVMLALGLVLLRTSAWSLRAVDEEVLGFREFLEEFFHGMNLPLRENNLPAECFSEERQELSGPLVGSCAMNIVEEASDIKRWVDFYVQENEEEFPGRILLEPTLASASDVALSWPSMSCFRQQWSERDEEPGEFLRT